MKLTLEIGGQDYRLRLPGESIAIGLDFTGAQPNTYGVPNATAAVYRQDGWVGDVREGGSCNFETYTLTPHCNGTHTECIGHITADRVQIHRQLGEALVPATLITVDPVAPAGSEDAYDPALNADDRVVDRAGLVKALAEVSEAWLQALVIRTLPNDLEKQSRDYMQVSPPFFTLEAMQYLRERGIRHLLVDMPSVDRLFDEGKLNAHHIFWDITGDGKGQLEGERMLRTVTEMVYVPDEITDGAYLLNLQIAPFLSDAAPSRPILIGLEAI